MNTTLLSSDDARTFYDHFGSKQDWQRFYEDPAVENLIAHLALGEARSVIEFGCGTGRLAGHLLRDHLPGSAGYLALDISSTMVRLTRERLRPFGARATVVQTNGEPEVAQPGESCDRFMATYVMDLLPPEAIRRLLSEAWRLLRPGGLLGLVTLTHGDTAPARLVEGLWLQVHRRRPTWVGGCRPLSLLPFLNSPWRIVHHAVVTRFAVSSEVLVAQRGGRATP